MQSAILQNATAYYILAQSAGNPSLLPLASDVSYFENDVPVPILESLLSQNMTWNMVHRIHDTAACTAFIELTAASNPHPYVIATRLVLTSTGDKITKIESVVSDAGDWLFNATSSLNWNLKESWAPIESSAQDSRSVIQAAGDAYLDSWGNGSVPVPYGTPCARLEGGLYTGERNASANSCVMPEFPVKPFYIGNRRYVIDQQLGAVAIFNDFPFLDKSRPNGTQSVNFVRVQRGEIRFIHEITVCWVNNCGR